jgi:hypothetical protein
VVRWLKKEFGPAWPTFRLLLICVATAAVATRVAVLSEIRPYDPWAMFLFVVVAGATITGCGSIVYSFTQLNKWTRQQNKAPRDAP